MPCGRGVPVEPGAWRDSEFGRLGIRERATLFASWEVRLVGEPNGDNEQRVLILANQDADCDGVVATSEREGYFKRGTQVVLGGWKEIRVVTAPLYE